MEPLLTSDPIRANGAFSAEGPLQQLIALAEASASGQFICDVEGNDVQVFLQAGRIAWATDARRGSGFLQHLRGHADIDDESLRHAMAESRQSQVPLSETLVAWKLATPEQVQSALRHQIRGALARLEQAPPSTKVVFLSRPQYARHTESLTFTVREIVAGSATPRPAERRPTPEARRPAAAKQPDGPGPTGRGDGGPRRGEEDRLAPEPRAARRARILIGAAVLALAVAGAIFATITTRRVGAKAGQAAAGPAPGVAAVDELVFGMTSQFSGANRDLARSMRAGLEAAFGIANDGGGVNGRKLRLLALDDAFDPARSLQNTKDLVENNKVFAVVGSRGTRQAAAVIPYLQEKKVVFLGSASGAHVLRRNPPDRYVFNYRPSTAEEAAAAVRYLVEVRRIPPSQVAYFCQDDEFGESGGVGVDEQLRTYRFDPARTVRLKYRRNTADVSAAVARVKKERSRVRAVVLVAVAQPAIQFIQQVKDLGGDVIFAAISNVDADVVAEALVSAGPRYVTDVVVTQVVPLPSSSSTSALGFQAALRKYSPGEKPGFFSFEGYIVGSILVEALRRAGKDPDSEGLVAALESLREVDLGIGTPISYGPREHQGSHKVWGTMLRPDATYKAIRLE